MLLLRHNVEEQSTTIVVALDNSWSNRRLLACAIVALDKMTPRSSTAPLDEPVSLTCANLLLFSILFQLLPWCKKGAKKGAKMVQKGKQKVNFWLFEVGRFKTFCHNFYSSFGLAEKFQFLQDFCQSVFQVLAEKSNFCNMVPLRGDYQGTIRGPSGDHQGTIRTWKMTLVMGVGGP